MVQNGCEALIPPEPLNNHGLRKLADALVQAERWDLALEVHLKCGLSTAGVMAANGLSCLRAGCFDTGMYIVRISLQIIIFITYWKNCLFSTRKILSLYAEIHKRNHEFVHNKNYF